MIPVKLKEIAKDNLEEALQRKVSPSQSGFVSSTAHALAQAYACRDTGYPFAILRRTPSPVSSCSDIMKSGGGRPV